MIIIDSISKTFGKIKALDNVTFKVLDGEAVGYVGLNGAGKTTTIRIIAGVLYPDKGEVYIDGYSVIKDKREASKRVGWVPEKPIFEEDMKALEYFIYLAGYYGIGRSEAKKIGESLLEDVGLGDDLYRRLREYSLGMKKRFALAVSMLSDPDNYVFDEVLHGLDPGGIAFFRELTRKFRKEGRAVLFSSHILSEVEAIVDKVVFIHRGRVLKESSIDEIKSYIKPYFKISLDRIDDNAISIASKYGNTRVVDNMIYISDIEEPSEVIRELVETGYRIYEAAKEEYTLEEYFFKLLRGEIK